jgi:hypothetical protein
MKCFNHPVADAVGICKNCNKGLCKDCLTELENGIACTATCVDEVLQINSLVNKSKTASNNTSDAYRRSAIMYAGMGVVFIIFGFILDGLQGFLSVMGTLFIIGAILSLVTAKKYRK